MDLDNRGVSISFLLRDDEPSSLAPSTTCSAAREGRCSARRSTRRRRTLIPSGGYRPCGAECLDWTLVLGRRHLLRLLRGYVRHYNQQRPHRGLALDVSVPCP
jgi:hypothetical protein